MELNRTEVRQSRGVRWLLSRDKLRSDLCKNYEPSVWTPAPLSPG